VFWYICTRSMWQFRNRREKNSRTNSSAVMPLRIRRDPIDACTAVASKKSAGLGMRFGSDISGAAQIKDGLAQGDRKMDAEAVHKHLKEELATAVEQVRMTSENFDAIIREVPPGIPHPD
jgi:hypothetical protein